MHESFSHQEIATVDEWNVLIGKSVRLYVTGARWTLGARGWVGISAFLAVCHCALVLLWILLNSFFVERRLSIFLILGFFSHSMSVFSPLPLSPCRFVLLVLAASLAYSSSLPPTRHRTSDLSVLNLTSANGTAPSSHLDAVDNDIWSWFCTRSPGWSSPALNPDDCTGVLDYFFVEALYDGGKGIMEFRAPGAKVSGDVKTQWTPRKYTFGKHFLVFFLGIVMVFCCVFGREWKLPLYLFVRLLFQSPGFSIFVSG